MSGKPAPDRVVYALDFSQRPELRTLRGLGTTSRGYMACGVRATIQRAEVIVVRLTGLSCV